MDPVKTSPQPIIIPVEFTSRFASAARAAGFKAQTYGAVAGHALVAYTRRTAGRRPRVYLSAGIHGDEPAPPLALLRLVETGFFDARCQWFICPLLNPTGFILQTRENQARIDLNRDYKDRRSGEVRAHVTWLQRQPNFDLAICAHEDWEATGFYLYELNPENQSTLAHAMIEAATSHGPVEAATVIDGRPVAEPGIVRPVGDPLLRENWPEAIYLRHQQCRLGYTIETSSGRALEQRIATQCAVLRAALVEFLR